jgi:TetR/AcrR family transcriptional repressor of nem operon
MRYKEFNTNSVLEKCINLFWRGGFGSSSIKDIVDETGVNRYSLYEEFENKEGILSNALELYLERYAEPNIAGLSKIGDVKDILESFYHSYLVPNEKHPPGCFIVHVATEMADHNPEIKSYLERYLNKIEKAIAMLLENNSFNHEDAKLARKFTTLFCYIMVFCVIRSPEEQSRVLKNEMNLILNKTYSNAEEA